MADAPILFLDIDGVLNSYEWYVRRDPAVRNGPDHDLAEFDPVAMARLKTILDRTGAEVVISSTWRRLHPLSEIRGFFAHFGIDTTRIIDTTPDGANREGPLWIPVQRGDEIRMWLQSSGHDGEYAVLDDDCDMDAVLDHFVRTIHKTGLLDEHVEEVCALLCPKEQHERTSAKEGS